MQVLEEVWRRLATVSRFEYEVSCGAGSQTGWAGCGLGEVTVEVGGCGEWIHFHERCDFKLEASGQVFAFRNQYRWNRSQLLRSRLRVEHWRRGEPVFLVELVEASDGDLVEVQGHVCAPDFYRLRMELVPGGVLAQWDVRGPKKEENICYCYR